MRRGLRVLLLLCLAVLICTSPAAATDLESYIDPQAVKDALEECGGVYFAAIGGCAAYMAACVERCDVVAYDDLIANGSMNACKEKGLVRSEGKEYVMQDGDVVLFRFNV